MGNCAKGGDRNDTDTMNLRHGAQQMINSDGTKSSGTNSLANSVTSGQSFNSEYGGDNILHMT